MFENIQLIIPDFECPEEVAFYKAEHELDGQMYILKKRRIYLKNDEEIHEHPAYAEISQIKNNRVSLDIRYVNSWIELDSKRYTKVSDPNDGLYVHLFIQMRYTNDFTKLASDMITRTKADQNLDEDTIEDMSEDTISKANKLITSGVSSRDAMIRTFSEIGFSKSTTPSNPEQEVWRLCFFDALSQK
jgi:hypothetical protein